MRILYGDLIGGASGDMFVAALLDLGLPVGVLKSELKKLSPLKFRLEVGAKKVQSIRATRFRVAAKKNEAERAWADIRRIVRDSALETGVKDRAIDIFARLAAAEAKIHGTSVERVHFHEVGGTDSIVDIVAAAIGVRYLKIDSFYFSRIPLGRGLTRARHGALPLPGPATLELLKGLPVQWLDVERETVTPTGAAIIAALGSRFGNPPVMTIEAVGYGAGKNDFPERPNVLRLVIGRDENVWDQDEMVVIETNIDDMNPEFYDYVLDRLFAAGARDVYLSPIQMKKNRPATLLRVIAEPALRETVSEILFQETSTIGLRYYPVKRAILKRAVSRVKTEFGAIKVKIVEQGDGTRRAAPEYEDLKRIAAAKKIPLKILYAAAIKSFEKRPGSGPAISSLRSAVKR